MTRLQYTQLQINEISISAELAMCLPVALYGYVCDQYSPRLAALFSGILFASGYFLASSVYSSDESRVYRGEQSQGHSLMTLGYIAIGAATSCLYISALATCAKNFGNSRHSGFYMSAPLAAFGLSGLWLSQVSTWLFREDGEGETGDLDIALNFKCMGVLLLIAGVLGAIGLQVRSSEHVDERRDHEPALAHDASRQTDELTTDVEAEGTQRGAKSSLTGLLDEQTRRFFGDYNMWLLVLGFIIVSGVGEAYQNNVSVLLTLVEWTRSLANVTKMGTVLDADTCDTSSSSASRRSYHIGVLAVASTAARFTAGIVSDRFGLRPQSEMLQHGFTEPKGISRVVILNGSSMAVLFGCLLMSLPGLHSSPSNQGCRAGFDSMFFTTAFIGAGYGSCFTLLPIIVRAVWGPQHFGLNWGFISMLSSVGVALWSLLYVWVYQRASGQLREPPADSTVMCTAGWRCFGSWAIAMTIVCAIAIIAWTTAWKGRRGWRSLGILV